MPRYKVLELSYIDDKLVDAGEIISYDPPEGTTIGDNLELLEDEKPAKGKAAAPAAAE